MKASKRHLFSFFLFALFLGLVGTGSYYYYTLLQNFKSTQEHFLAQKTGLESRIEKMNQEIESLRADNMRIASNLLREENKNEIFEDQIREITGTVGDLTTLAETDEELLQKYSKVYFLSEHYTPSNLSLIKEEDLYSSNGNTHIHTDVLPYLEDMITDARRSGVNLLIISAYRSFGQQSGLKTQYLSTYGSGANEFSAEQGYSEHQLGTTVDFTTPELGANFENFDTTEAYQWLLSNAHRYGFTLSYPEENSYYQFEPWHWRFVGIKLAEELHDRSVYFYDMSQREIDDYLIHLFE